MPSLFGAYTLYYSALFVYGYIGAGPRYCVCPYQPAGALYKHVCAKKITKMVKKVPKIVKNSENLQQDRDTVIDYVIKYGAPIFFSSLDLI